MRKPKQTAEEIMLNRWRKLNPTENRDLQILELDWPVAIDILHAAIKIMTDHHHKADQLEDVITQLMSQVLIAYAQASRQHHTDDAYRLLRTVESIQRFLLHRYVMDVSIEALVTNPRVVALIQRAAA
ncbi:hypothetical protein A1356_14065 [Methylomonas koyamae]|uniref:Uncharacterized protein n=2 Tax=Methylococcaceae TaxID=403 RepID=A0AA91DBG5_9GAMM|nr:hypothetical protein AYM39_21740 [Methylomonas sp. DH-1]OAI25107.1 hypothetical protein A1356_14065 [Methylomonas koyamae]